MEAGILNSIISRIEVQVNYSIKNSEDLDAVSWNYEEGILVSVNEAILILECLKKQNEQA